MSDDGVEVRFRALVHFQPAASNAVITFDDADEAGLDDADEAGLDAVIAACVAEEQAEDEGKVTP